MNRKPKFQLSKKLSRWEDKIGWTTDSQLSGQADTSYIARQRGDSQFPWHDNGQLDQQCLKNLSTAAETDEIFKSKFFLNNQQTNLFEIS